MKNCEEIRESVGRARCEKAACRKLFGVLRYRRERASKRAGIRTALVTTEKIVFLWLHPILQPLSSTGELWGRVNTSPFKVCRSRCAPLAWRGMSGGHVCCETPTEVVLHSLSWVGSLQQELTLHAEVVKRENNLGIDNISHIQVPHAICFLETAQNFLPIS